MAAQPQPDIEVLPIPPEQTHVLRHTVLRQHQTLEEMVYPGDTLETTLHLGAFRSFEALPTEHVGIVTLSSEPMPGASVEGDWRLRGMAVAASAQGMGVGRMIVERALLEASDRGVKRIWCKARVSAMGFYEKLGFAAAGDVFEIAGIGPHYVMWIDLA